MKLDLKHISSDVADERLNKLIKMYENDTDVLKVLEALVLHFTECEYSEVATLMARQKMRHMLEVPIAARLIAHEEGIDDIRVLKLIDICALLHDWGRLYDIKEESFYKSLGHPKAGAKDLFDNNKIDTILPNLSDSDKNIIYFTVLLHGVESVDKELLKDGKLKLLSDKEPFAKLICRIIRNADRWANNVDFLIEDYKVIVGANSYEEIWSKGLDNQTREELLNGMPINRSKEGVEYTRLRQLASHIGWVFADDNLPSYINWIYKTRWPEKYALLHVPNNTSELSDKSYETINDFMDLVKEVMIMIDNKRSR